MEGLKNVPHNLEFVHESFVWDTVRPYCMCETLTLCVWANGINKVLGLLEMQYQRKKTISFKLSLTSHPKPSFFLDRKDLQKLKKYFLVMQL